MKRYRIKGQSVISNFDRDQSQTLIAKLAEEGLLEARTSEIFSVNTQSADGRQVVAHISPWEVALVRMPSF